MSWFPPTNSVRLLPKKSGTCAAPFFHSAACFPHQLTITTSEFFDLISAQISSPGRPTFAGTTISGLPLLFLKTFPSYQEVLPTQQPASDRLLTSLPSTPG